MRAGISYANEDDVDEYVDVDEYQNVEVDAATANKGENEGESYGTGGSELDSMVSAR
ncbi:hypothetical protein PAECIP111893_03557 [Paenibacillus plantiphilus]|uniref:DUF4025 domain-containing protein n=1 Tax=Paenibacillus plantiphilus TaxID=2905650 RepID=A0ABN8GM83_9BACL|nr:hypothetical protein [Paenibacillus plantiphilus]CAH1212540.1 hypothetical protein PAECIP111893_03557 [Paenibacillus plantiphilus]